ncbi:glycosyltransferase family 2 protein [bacterium]|nr:glycosyltransferase family 2 protein [bacterium]
MDLSVVIPVYNEQENVERLHSEITTALSGYSGNYEIIFVDDGSKDDTASELSRLLEKDPHLIVIVLSNNFGQTAAMSAGFDHAQGEVIVTMDGDLQNNPGDITRMLALINEGYDVVSGWRRNRKDTFLNRRLPSWLANQLISWVTGVYLHDYGCTLKAYRKRFIKNIRLYGEMHRFIPAYAAWLGARIIELEVNHRPRTAGKSKYGIFRAFKVVLDLFTVKFLGSFSSSPIYLFGMFGFLLASGGVLAGVVTLIEKFTLGVWVHKNPLILLAIFLFILGFQFILIGLLAELLIRTYHESQNKPPYFIKEVLKKGRA